MATRRAAFAGTEWLRAWALGLGKSSAVHPLYEQLAAEHCASIRELIADHGVLKRLTVAYGHAEARLGQVDARATLENFLVDASWICNHAASALQQAAPQGTTPSRSEAVGELRILAAAVVTLATSLRRARVKLGAALDTDYLRKRHQAGNPRGFIFQRKGWQLARPRAGVTVDLYLDALAADIEEEAELHQIAVDSRRQVGGKLAPYYPVIDMLTVCSSRLSASPDFVLIAGVINSLVTPDPPLEPDAIRKRHTAKKQRKTHT